MDYKFNHFAEKLEKKFSKNYHLITEDLIRYWYITTIGEFENAAIERPYRNHEESLQLLKSTRARADLYYSDTDVVIEFKFHKKLDSSCSCKTDNLGLVVGDMNRLSLLNCEHKLLIYIFDQEMYGYYQKHKPQLIRKMNCSETFTSQELFTNLRDRTLDKIALAGFCKGAKNKLSYAIKTIYSATITDRFFLRIYEVKSDKD